MNSFRRCRSGFSAWHVYHITTRRAARLIAIYGNLLPVWQKAGPSVLNVRQPADIDQARLACADRQKRQLWWLARGDRDRPISVGCLSSRAALTETNR